jgi:hypothetical protein
MEVIFTLKAAGHFLPFDTACQIADNIIFDEAGRRSALLYLLCILDLEEPESALKRNCILARSDRQIQRPQFAGPILLKG